MKCTACGYEKRHKVMKTVNVKRYKSGPRKGQIKEIEEEVVDIFANDPEFVEILVAKGSVNTHIENKYMTYSCSQDYEEVSIYACPMCGTLRINTY